MGTLLEEFNAMKIKVAKAMAKNDQAALNAKIHVVDHSVEKIRKTTPGKQTRFGLDCGTNEVYRELFIEWERILEEVKNKTMAIDFVIRALRLADKAQLDAWRNEGEVAHKEPDF
jgi:hypothetical protein